MISVTFFEWRNGEERQITMGSMHHAPSVGEKIWLLPNTGVEGDRQTAYEVEDVCHWVSDKIQHHAVAVYVKPLS